MKTSDGKCKSFYNLSAYDDQRKEKIIMTILNRIITINDEN